METVPRFATFEEYRDRMLSIMDGAAPSIGDTPPRSSEALDLARNRMARTLTAYHLYAQRELFHPFIAIAAPMERERTRHIERECAELAHDFREFTRRCATDPVIGRWATYRGEAMTMMARIREHLRNAETVVRWCRGGLATYGRARAA